MATLDSKHKIHPHSTPATHSSQLLRPKLQIPQGRSLTSVEIGVSPGEQGLCFSASGQVQPLAAPFHSGCRARQLTASYVFGEAPLGAKNSMRGSTGTGVDKLPASAPENRSCYPRTILRSQTAAIFGRPAVCVCKRTSQGDLMS